MNRCGEGDRAMEQIETNYRALLAVVVVLNSQRDTHSLWEAITAEITKVIPWARASVTLYDREVDGFRFYVMATTMAEVVLQRDTVIPRIGSGRFRQRARADRVLEAVDLARGLIGKEDLVIVVRIHVREPESVRGLVSPRSLGEERARRSRANPELHHVSRLGFQGHQIEVVVPVEVPVELVHPDPGALGAGPLLDDGRGSQRRHQQRCQGEGDKPFSMRHSDLPWMGPVEGWGSSRAGR